MQLLETFCRDFLRESRGKSPIMEGFLKVLLNLGKSSKTFQHTNITLFD